MGLKHKKETIVPFFNCLAAFAAIFNSENSVETAIFCPSKHVYYKSVDQFICYNYKICYIFLHHTCNLVSDFILKCSR